MNQEANKFESVIVHELNVGDVVIAPDGHLVKLVSGRRWEGSCYHLNRHHQPNLPVPSDFVSSYQSVRVEDGKPGFDIQGNSLRKVSRLVK